MNQNRMLPDPIPDQARKNPPAAGALRTGRLKSKAVLLLLAGFFFLTVFPSVVSASEPDIRREQPREQPREKQETEPLPAQSLTETGDA